MWHEPILLLPDHLGVIGRSGGSLPVATLVVVAVSVTVGWVSSHVIEKPTGKLRGLRDEAGRPREYYPDLVRSGRE